MLHKAHLLNFLLFLLPFTSYASGDQLCDLIGAKNIINNDTIIECIDFKALHNDTITVYGDVSSISKDGLALCPLIDIEVENPDIVYILDQSQSMPAKTIHIYEDTDDTIISFNGPGNFSISATDTISSPWEFDFIELPRFFNANKKNSTARANYSGDPYGLSAIALHKTIDYQAARSKTSTAGFCGLHNRAAHPFSPKPLNNNNLQEIKDSIFINDYVGKTYFYPSLAKAKEWLTDTTICKNKRKMIIFISDGCPTNSTNNKNDKWDYLELLNENDINYPGTMPAIYGVFLGYEGTTNYAPLQELSDTTGGSFYIVPPNDPDSLVGVLKALIEKSFETPPLDISLTNTTIFPNQTSKVDENSVVEQADGSWQMIMDSTLGLIPGLNQIDIEMKKSTWEGVSDTSYFSFHINVAELGEEIDSSFEEICYDKVSAKVKNSNGNYTKVLTEKDTLCKLFFNVYKFTPLTFFPIKMISTQFNDTELVTIEISDISNENSDTSRLILVNEFLFLSNDTLVPTTGNNRIETCALDTIILSWQNPRNREDYLLDTIFVEGEKIIFNPINAAVFDTSENGKVDLLKITFDKSVPKEFPLNHAYWNRIDPASDFESIESMSKDSNVITYRFTKEYGSNVTSIPENITENENPKVIFKEEAKYSLGIETISISDSVMYSPVRADVWFADMSSPLSPDTLKIIISEYLMDINFDKFNLNFLRVNFIIFPDSLNPTLGYEDSRVLDLQKYIKIDTVDDYILLTFLLDGKSEFLNRDATLYINRDTDITDLNNNTCSRKGVGIRFHSQLYYTLPENNDLIINSYEWPANSTVNVNLIGLSKTDTIDTLVLTLTTNDNDVEVVNLTETGNNTGIYKGAFNSVYKEAFKENDNLVEGVYENKFEPDTTIIKGEMLLPYDTIETVLKFIYQEKPPVNPTVLYVENSNDEIVNLLSDSDSLINILVDIYRDNVPESSFVNIYTSKFHDSERVLFTLNDSDINYDSIRIILSRPIDFISSDTIAPTVFNNILEATANDSIYLSWYSKDKSDEAFDTVIVIGTPIIFNPLYAAAFDKNNNGQVDLIKIKFDKKVPKVFNLESVSWPSTSIADSKFAGALGIIADSIIEYDFKADEFEENKTSANFKNPPSLRFKEELFYNLGKSIITIHDSTGTVPVYAKILKSEQNSDSPDTLIIKLSEAFSAGSIIPSPVRINDTITYNPTNPAAGYFESRHLMIEPGSKINISNGSDENLIHLLLSKDNLIEKGSTLYLNDSSSLIDNCKNRSGRKGVPLSIYGKLYFTKEDIIDSAVFEYISPFDSILVAVLDIESITDGIDTLHLAIKTSGGDFEEFVMTETTAASGVFKVIVPIHFSDSVEVENGIINGKYLNGNITFTDTIFGTVQHTIQKSNNKVPLKYFPSPKIIAAVYSFSDLNTHFPDTLRLTFNTSLSLNLKTFIGIYDYWNGIDKYSDNSGAIMLQANTIQRDSLRAMILVSREDALVPSLDSIRFIPNSINVVSTGGVNPIFSGYCPVTYNNIPSVNIAVVPNPIGYTEGKIEITPPIQFNGQIINGALFLISSRLLIKSAEIVIIDVIGEILFKSDAVYDNDHQYLYSVWNGKNKKSRVCGPGTYIANVKVVDVNENLLSKKLYIGIRDLDAESINPF